MNEPGMSNINAPSFLIEMIEWEKRIRSRVPYLENPTGLFLGIIGDGNGFYSCSPIDSIKFADTGMDGIHYSLLTDFGWVTNLEEAPVICVSPMDFGNCVRLVARNLHDFFALQLGGHDFLLLNEFSSRQHYMEALAKQQEDEHSEFFNHDKWKQERDLVWEMAQEHVHFPIMSDPYGYIEQLRAEREERIVIPTEDRLGIVSFDPDHNCYTSHPWQGTSIPYDELQQLKEFLHSAPHETKLAFIRDYQAQAIADTPSQLLICEELERMGMPLAARRLLHCMNVQW